MPNWSQTKAASSGERRMFFGDSGSIAGRADVHVGRSVEPGGDVLLEVEDRSRRSSRTYGTSRSIASGFGDERSMWQRQIQLFAFSGTCLRIAAGCGSWTMITSQPPEISLALSAL